MFATRCPHAQRLQTYRSFSSSAPHRAWSQKQKLAHENKDNTPYPYGPSLLYKQSNEGLYGGQRIRFGNNVSERTEIKTRRKWRPNIHRKTLYSVALDQRVKVRVSTRVLRTIDKVGGLDEYLLGDKTSRIKELGMKGWHLRCMVLAQPEVQAKMNRQRAEYGLPEVDYSDLNLRSGKPPVQTSVAGLQDEGGEFEVEADQTEEVMDDDLEEVLEEDVAEEATGNETFNNQVREENESTKNDGTGRV